MNSFTDVLTLCHTIPNVTTSKKTLENTVVTSIFSFSHSVFDSIKETNCHFSNVSFVVWKCFQFRYVQNLSFGKELNPIFTRPGSSICATKEYLLRKERKMNLQG